MGFVWSSITLSFSRNKIWCIVKRLTIYIYIYVRKHVDLYRFLQLFWSLPLYTAWIPLSGHILIQLKITSFRPPTHKRSEHIFLMILILNYEFLVKHRFWWSLCTKGLFFIIFELIYWIPSNSFSQIEFPYHLNIYLWFYIYEGQFGFIKCFRKYSI